MTGATVTIPIAEYQQLQRAAEAGRGLERELEQAYAGARFWESKYLTIANTWRDAAGESWLRWKRAEADRTAANVAAATAAAKPTRRRTKAKKS